MRTTLFFLLLFLFLNVSLAQDGYGNQWIFGRFETPYPSGTILNFNGDILKTEPIDKPMELEGSCAIMCDSAGKLLFYSNGCYIADATHQMMENGDSIGKGYLESSFCNTGGNPERQSIIALPKPGSNHLYYLFYTDIGNPYYMQPFFPLAPITLYYAVIDMELENGLGAVVEKNKIILQDTFSRGLIQAAHHANGKDWWVVMPKSHSNCYWTFLFAENGIDTIFKQYIGPVWGDNDPQGQAVFSPNKKRYVRFNFFYGLNIFDFDNSAGLFSNLINIGFGQDTFYFNGAVFSPNSRFIYAPSFNKLWQFDTWANDISASRILIGELNTPSQIQEKTRFNQARLASDGKIYIAGTGPHKHLHVINRPNCYGLECDLQQYAIELAARNSYTMPNMPHYKQWSESDTCEAVSAQAVLRLPERGIRIFPNPTTGQIHWDELENEEVTLRVYDTLGRLCLQTTTRESQTDFSGLASGLYFWHIVTRSGIVHSGKIERQ